MTSSIQEGEGGRTYFFSDPSFSLRDVYCPFSVLYTKKRHPHYNLRCQGFKRRTMNHLRTATDLSSSVFESAIAANSSGRSHQYALTSKAYRQPFAQHTKNSERTRTWELGERDGREDERRGGETRQVTRDACDPTIPEVKTKKSIIDNPECPRGKIGGVKKVKRTT